MGDVRLLDRRLVYGASCSWWDSIDKVGRTGGPTSIPCCPHCGGVLYEMENEERWWRSVESYSRENSEPGYRKFVEWSRGKCFETWVEAKAAYAAEENRGA